MHGPRRGWHVLKDAKAIQLAEYRSGVHAFLAGVFTRQDIEEGVIPIPLVNLVEFRVRSSTINDSWNAAYNQICQTHFFHNRTAPGRICAASPTRRNPKRRENRRVPECVTKPNGPNYG